MLDLKKKYVNASALGIEVSGSLVVGLLFGLWLDSKFETKPALTLIFFFFGLAAGAKALFRFYKQNMPEAENEHDG